MKCVHCGKELSSFSIVDEDDNPVCNNCFDKYYETCESCRRAIPRGARLCQSCSEVVFKKVINGYCTKVANRFGNKSDNIKCLNDRYYGLEMEYNYFSPSVARVLFKKQYDDKLIYNKSDSSISSGVEIVTIPLVKSKVIKLIDDMDISRIKSNSSHYTVGYNAGLHIHVSRNTITPIAINRLSILFNSEWAKPYKNYIYYLVGRLERWLSASDNCGDNYYRIGTASLLSSIRGSNMSSHGIALNLGNKNTVEFRIFKATNNPEQLKSYIEFTELAIEFAEKEPIKMMTIPNFMVYLYLNSTNGWLRKRLEYIKEKEPEIYNVKEKIFTCDYYLSKFKGLNEVETYDLLREIKSYVYKPNINWDVEKINADTIRKWKSLSCGSSIEYNKLVDKLMYELKKRTVKKILAK